MDKLLARLASAPRLVLVGTVVVLLLCSPLMMRLTKQVIPGGFESRKSSAVTAQQILTDDFHTAPNTVVAVVESDGSTDAAADQIVANAKRLPGFLSARSYRDDPQLTVQSGHLTMIQIQTSADAAEAVRTVKDVRTALGAGLPGGATLRLTGEAALNGDYNDQTAKDAVMAETIAFPVLIILLLLVFRSVIAMLVPITIGVFTLVAAEAVGGLATYFTDVSNLYVNAVSIIGLAVSVDYSLFVMRRYTQERDGGKTGSEALLIAFKTTGRSVLFGGVIVLVSLAGLFIPDVMVLRSIAIAGIAATAVAMLLTAVALPAILTLWGDKIYARNRFLVGKGRAKSAPRETGSTARRPRSTVFGLAAAVIMAGLAVPLVVAHLQVPVASADNLPHGAESRVAAQVLADQFGVPMEQPIDLVFRADAGDSAGKLVDAANRVATELSARPDVAGVQHPDGNAADAAVYRISVIPKKGSSAADQHKLVRDIKVMGDRLDAGIHLYPGGVAVVGYDFDKVVTQSLPLLVGAVLVLSLLLLYWVFRSWILALCAVVLNNLVIGAAAGLLILIFQIGLGKPVSTMQPVLIFAVMFGMSMDYLIVMASRMREEYRAGRAHPDAVAAGLRATTPVITVAAAVMATVFLSFLVAKIDIVAQLGTGLAIAVILDAVVLRRLVVPAVFTVIGPRLWGRADNAGTGAPQPELQPAVH